MQKIITVLIILTLSAVVKAQSSSEENKIKSTIDTFFEGLHKGDSSIVKSSIHTSLKLQTTFMDKELNAQLRTQKRNELLEAIASKKKEDIYFEKLLSYEVHVDGNLASVWTPYEFYYNGKLSHCGANSFQLFNNNGKWEIIYIVDMRRRKNCNNTRN
ncbi:Putative lumazine-binding [Tenacibaculum sp. MAR_2009_124]|uniref:nuclear transport factor 2 family protein n=1 Tax=Tenacibaculum sp. MAR_2009_124 TaxID=1250059 RepID=UPI0008976772|nr:nuclear transport factor 2 family protein [Tenacibaculum sp. MAR_2009_124]SEB96569.1 Putative lumazine-binding [Tenacibaculum sp. MAR_2009_124]